jgi:8-oxo-dGTP diphosphatase
VTLKNYICAFLENDGCFLLMKRAPNREVNPNFWSGVGGKIEPCEINDPYSACVREIKEETGITNNNIENLKLRYIIIRKHKDVIRQSYIYFGKVNTKSFMNTDEGTLYWIAKEELKRKHYTSTYTKMIEHYLSSDADDNNIFIGVAESVDGKLEMCWSEVEDFID